jgi:hypothetical protein
LLPEPVEGRFRQPQPDRILKSLREKTINFLHQNPKS